MTEAQVKARIKEIDKEIEDYVLDILAYSSPED